MLEVDYLALLINVPIEDTSRSELNVSSCEPSLSCSSDEGLLWTEGSLKSRQPTLR